MATKNRCYKFAIITHAMALSPKDFVYVPATSPFKDICSLSWFAVNLAYYLVFSMLIVFIVYKIAKAIQHIAQSDSSETMEKLRENATDIVLSVIGLFVVSSAIFFPKTIVATFGVSDAKNPFASIPVCD